VVVCLKPTGVHLPNSDPPTSKSSSVKTTTVNLGVLYPTNVHQNLAKGTLDFIHYMCDKVVGGKREGKYIINMDQTLVFLYVHWKNA
jgi:hypothetical protein